jgi:hypothetical protein
MALEGGWLPVSRQPVSDRRSDGARRVAFAGRRRVALRGKLGGTLHDAKLFEFVIHPIVQRSASLYCFYMGWKQITFALLTVTAAGAALTFAIDLGRYAFASWH